MQVPKLEKIVVNIGLGEAIRTPRRLMRAVSDLTPITGQRPVVTRAKKSIAAFKLRAGMPIGAMVTLRGQRMYEFLDRLVAWRCRASVTSAAFRRTRSTAAATTRWVCGSRSIVPGDRLRQDRQDARPRGQLRDHRARLMKKGGGC